MYREDLVEMNSAHRNNIVKSPITPCVRVSNQFAVYLCQAQIPTGQQPRPLLHKATPTEHTHKATPIIHTHQTQPM